MKEQHKNDNYSELTLRLKSVIETAIDGIITISERGVVESINPAAARLFGYMPDEVIGNNINILMPPPFQEEHDGYINNYRNTQKAKIIGIGREVKGKKKDGTIFPFRLAVSEVLLKSRRIFTGIVHDLSDVKEAETRIQKLNEELEQKVKERTDELAETVNKLLTINQQLEHEVKERKAAEKALRQLLEKEKELNEMKSRFVSMASHQFRTPLSSVLSSAELIEAYQSDDDKQTKRDKHTDRIKAAVTNLTDILNEFLSLSKLEEGKIELQPVAFTLKDFCKEVREETEGLLKPDQQIRHHNSHPDTIVFLDKKFLKNVLFNLLSNAVKYSEAGKPIDCTTKILDNSKRNTKGARRQLIIEVADQGMGIPKEEQKHLFTRFFRAHNSENIQGTGLGLNIVRRYVELMNGTIEFESEMGVGSTFTVTIPLKTRK